MKWGAFAEPDHARAKALYKSRRPLLEIMSAEHDVRAATCVVDELRRTLADRHAPQAA